MDDDDIATNLEHEAPEDPLLERLRAIAAEVDPVPEYVLAAANAALSTLDLDGELAVLIADSSATEPDLAGAGVGYEPVRAGAPGAGASRLLTFAGGGVQVDIEVNQHGDRLDLFGQFTGASLDDCVLEHATTGPRLLEVDSLGRFIISDARRGPMRARCRSATGARVLTAWVSI
jgi:hypothetical protein